MGMTTGNASPPRSTDLEGWRRAVTEGLLDSFRLEETVAAIQDLGPCTDQDVLNPLAKHVSDALLRILRGRVSCYHPDQGFDIIEQTHEKIIEAMLKPTSADGKSLRVAFVPRVCFRLKDAIANAARRARESSPPLPEDPGPDRQPSIEHDQHQAALDAARSYDPSCTINESIDVESILEKITDDRKRLAFRLHMDGIPFKSKKSSSIAAALGISEKTAREWIKEVQALLQPVVEVQDLLKMRTRGMP